MSDLRFAARRLFTTPWFALFFLLVLLAAPFAQRAAAEVSVPAPVYTVEGAADADAARIASYLEEAGFRRAASREELVRAVEDGSADAGIVIPGSLSAQLAEGDPAGCLLLVRSPNSLQADLWQEHASAALFTVYAPYITADALEGSGLSDEEIFGAYYAHIDGEKLFSFELLSEKGAVSGTSERQDRFFLGTLALSLFAAVCYAAAWPVTDGTRELSLRIGRQNALAHFFLPGMALRLCLLFMAGAGAALFCSRGRMVGAVLAYVLCLAVFGLFLKVLPGRNWQSIFCLFILLASLALCPVYTDLSLLVPAVGTVRCFLPPYWLWILAG